MTRLPFSVFKRTGRRFFYVQFKNKTGDYLPAISTRQTTEAAAIETAFKWYHDGRPETLSREKAKNKDGGNIRNKKSANDIINVSLSLRESLREIKTSNEAEFICRELKRQGLLKNYVMAGTKQDVDFGSFLLNFWDYDTSPYIKEKLRKNHGIHRNYTKGQKLVIQKYWVPFFKGRLLGEIMRQDIELFIEDVAVRSLSAARKNLILKAGTIPLKWAFFKEIIDKNVALGITWFAGKAKERRILSPEIVQAIFRVTWKNDRSRLANMLAAVTGLRAGEIQALRVQDIGEDCLYIRHSWNPRDDLKTTKNNKCRVVEVPFPLLIEELMRIARRNPHGINTESYIFWAMHSPSKPVNNVLFLSGLRDALMKIGMSEKEAKSYLFHGWRHYFTSYMKGRLDKKLLKFQTGHLTDPMLEHYGDHLLEGDRKKIQQAQQEVFGELIPKNRLKKLL
jgi:integrase